MLINNADIAHYMPFDELPVNKIREVLQIKTMAPTLLSHAAVSGMKARGLGAIINVAGMIAFSCPAPATTMPRRTVRAPSCRSPPHGRVVSAPSF